MTLGELRDQLQRAVSAELTVERELGGGGMSRVFLATDRALDRAVVIKTLPPELASAVGLERFRREIEVAARLQHPHIVPLISAGVADGAPYYTMPFVEGETLRDRLNRGRLPVIEAVQILREVADALSYAHRRGVVHRDIKPENILISDRHALVTDFGVAKAFAAASADPTPPTGHSITQFGITVGTPAYMAPEQVSADPDIDHRADLYSLGILGYEMLVGTPPFHGMPPSKLLAAHVSAAPVPIQRLRPDVPPELSALLFRCLSKDPVDRPATAADVLAELETISAETAPKRRRRPRRSAIVAGLAMVGIVGAIGLILPRNLWAMLTVLVSRPPAVLRPNRVIVAPLRNETGDSTFDHFGDFASNQVADALTQLTALTVIDGRTAVLNDRIVKRVPMLSWFHGADRAIADQTGAGLVVAGAFYREGRRLRIHAKITDFATGKIIQPLGEISGSVDSASALVTTLSRRVFGTMAQALDTNVTTPFGAFGTPPSLEAYTEMMNGFLAYARFDPGFAAHYRRSMSLDSDYATPVVLLALGATFRDQRPLADSMVVRATRLKNRLTPAEGLLIDHVAANLRADGPEVQRTVRRLLAAVPGSMEIPLLAAGAELSVGDPAAAIAALSHTYPDRGLNLVSSYYWRNLGEAQHQLGHHDQALKTFHDGVTHILPPDTRLAEWEATELVDLGRDDEVDRSIERGGSEAERLAIAAGAVDALVARGRDGRAEGVAMRWLGKIRLAVGDSSRATRYDLARLRAAARQWDSVRIALRPLLSGEHDGPFRDALTIDAVAALHLGDLKAVARADSMLAAVTDRYDYGQAGVHRAEIAAQRGDVSRAEILLEAAMHKGYGLQFTNWPIERDPWLAPLRATAWFDARATRARFLR